MPTYIKGKIPWLKIAFIGIIILFVIFVVYWFVPGAAALILGGVTGFFNGIYNFFVVSPTFTSVAVAVCITAGVLILITQRKYFFKQKVSEYNLTGATPALQGAPLQTQAFANPTVAQLVNDPNKTEVTTS